MRGERRLYLPLVYFPAPIPPSPFPAGRGRLFTLFRRGLAPPAPLHLTACGTYRTCQAGTRRGGLPSLPPAYPAFTFFSAPIPPAPFPSGEGGDSRLFHARGFAPCIPGAEPGRRWLFLWKTVPQGGLVPGVVGWLCCAGARGGLACFVACLPCHLFAVFPPSPRPRSQSALPGGEGGDLRLFHARGFAPCIPGAKSLTALTDSAVSVPGASLPWNRARACVHENNREKFLGVGGFFQEAPNASPFYSFSNAARVQAGFKTHSRSG